MDQTASADQSLLRYERERCEDTGVDCHQRLRARGHRQERTRDRTVSARNLANPQRDVCQFAEYLYRSERILIRPVEAGFGMSLEHSWGCGWQRLSQPGVERF